MPELTNELTYEKKDENTLIEKRQIPKSRLVDRLAITVRRIARLEAERDSLQSKLDILK